MHVIYIVLSLAFKDCQHIISLFITFSKSKNIYSEVFILHEKQRKNLLFHQEKHLQCTFICVCSKTQRSCGKRGCIATWFPKTKKGEDKNEE